MRLHLVQALARVALLPAFRWPPLQLAALERQLGQALPALLQVPLRFPLACAWPRHFLPRFHSARLD